MAVTLHAPAYPASLLTHLKTFWDSGQLCDFSLVAGERSEVRVHSVVLLGASEFFRGLMAAGTLQEPRYTLQAASVESLYLIIEFMYTGHLTLTQETIWIVLALASQLQMPEAIQLCQKYLAGGTDSGIAETLNEQLKHEPKPAEDPIVFSDLGDHQEFTLNSEDEENFRSVEPDSAKDEVGMNDDQAKNELEDMLNSFQESDVWPTEVSPKKSRGRPKGSKNKSPEARNKLKFQEPRKRGRPKKHVSDTDYKPPLILKLAPIKPPAFKEIAHIVPGENRFECDKPGCEAKFSLASMLKFHQRLHWPSKYWDKLQAQLVLKKLRTASSSSSSKCLKCPKSFTNSNYLRGHYLKKHSKRSVFNTCFCSTRVFSNAKHLNLHKIQKHRQSLLQKFKYKSCSKCSRQFLFKRNLQKHNEQAHGIRIKTEKTSPQRRLKKCEEPKCGFVATSKVEMLKHMTNCHAEVGFRCPECNFSTRLKRELVRHKKRVHSHPRPSVVNICEICGKSFPRHSRLKLHMFSKHKVQDPSLKIYPCPVQGCRYASAFKDCIDRHLVKHRSEKPYKCGVCGKLFKMEKSVEKHTRRVHMGIRDYVCDICGASYGEESELKIHMVRHSDVKTYHCDICDYSTHDKGNYKTHLYGKHSIKMDEDMKIFECELCDFSTSTKYRFSDHMRVHYQQRDIPCTICNKLFMTRKAMYGHVKKVHKPKDFRCGVCAYSTSDKSKLNDHVRIMHTHRNFKPYKCPYCTFQCATGGNCRKHVKHKHKDQEVRYLKLSDQEAEVGVPEPTGTTEIQEMQNLYLPMQQEMESKNHVVLQQQQQQHLQAVEPNTVVACSPYVNLGPGFENQVTWHALQRHVATEQELVDVMIM